MQTFSVLGFIVEEERKEDFGPLMSYNFIPLLGLILMEVRLESGSFFGFSDLTIFV